jgi:hypothetical protein
MVDARISWEFYTTGQLSWEAYSIVQENKLVCFKIWGGENALDVSIYIDLPPKFNLGLLNVPE